MIENITVRALKRELKKIDGEISKIDDLLDANPLSEICEIREKAAEILDQNKGDYETISKLIGPLAEREKELFKIARKQTSTNSLVDRKVRLMSDRGRLINDIFFAEKK